MDRVPDISAEAVLPLQDDLPDRELSQNATRIGPLAEAVPASTARRRPMRHRLLLADRVDRQFPLTRST